MDNLDSTQKDVFEPESLEMSTDAIKESNEKIAELSKKGYQLLKESEFDQAREAFFQILDIEDNNNYALVGLGDTARKENKFNDAITYYNKCLSPPSCHSRLLPEGSRGNSLLRWWL